MQLDETKAAEMAVFQGKTYYFCSTSCKAAFEKDPQEYAEY